MICRLQPRYCARHFAKGDSRKPADDKGAKTRPSQYTKKFKQMYGEQEKEPPKSDQAKKRDEFEKLQKAKELLLYNIVLQKTKKLLQRWVNKMKEVLLMQKRKIKRIRKRDSQKSFKDRYGKDGFYYATLTKMAKNRSYDLSENEEERHD